MLSGGLSDTYRNALARSHTRYSEVSVLDGFGNVLETDISFISGAVSATLTSRVSRTLNLRVPSSLYPDEETDLLAPYGNYVRVRRGVLLADDRPLAWTIFYGRVQHIGVIPGGMCQLIAADRGQDIDDAKFVTPSKSNTNNTVPAEIKRRIIDGVTNPEFGDFDYSDIPVQAVTPQLDRAQTMDDLATTASGFWYALADGRFVFRKYPWTVESTAVVTYSDTDDGMLTETYPSRSRENVWNSLSVTGERLSADPGVYGLAQDLYESSPTYVNGSFGLKHQLLRLQTPANQDTADSAARQNLRRLKGLTESWSWKMTPDPALELGDTVRLNARSRSVEQVVVSFTIPVDDGVMEVAGRAKVLAPLESGVSG